MNRTPPARGRLETPWRPRACTKGSEKKVWATGSTFKSTGECVLLAVFVQTEEPQSLKSSSGSRCSCLLLLLARQSKTSPGNIKIVLISLPTTQQGKPPTAARASADSAAKALYPNGGWKPTGRTCSLQKSPKEHRNTAKAPKPDLETCSRPHSLPTLPDPGTLRRIPEPKAG